MYELLFGVLQSKYSACFRWLVLTASSNSDVDEMRREENCHWQSQDDNDVLPEWSLYFSKQYASTKERVLLKKFAGATKLLLYKVSQHRNAGTLAACHESKLDLT